MFLGRFRVGETLSLGSYESGRNFVSGKSAWSLLLCVLWWSKRLQWDATRCRQGAVESRAVGGTHDIDSARGWKAGETRALLLH